jgi:hypothetical protein
VFVLTGASTTVRVPVVGAEITGVSVLVGVTLTVSVIGQKGVATVGVKTGFGIDAVLVGVLTTSSGVTVFVGVGGT